MDIILASLSPRRKEILSKFGIDFEIMDSCVDERAIEAEFVKNCKESTPVEWVKMISAKKAEAVGKRAEGEKAVIAADTIVTYDNKILNKPADYDDAVNMLRELSGKKHIVYTGFAVLYKN